MKCKHCKQDGLPEHAIYCCWCGKKLAKTKDEISVPKPKKKKDGTYTAQIMVNGKRVSVPPQLTEAKYYAMAKAMKVELVAAEAVQEKITLGKACDNYIESRSNVLSPSTIYGYQRIRHNRFKTYMDKEVHTIDFQKMVNEEATLCNAKTLKNAWGFIASTLKSCQVNPGNIAIGQVIRKDLPWLDNEQIKLFIKATDDMEKNRKIPFDGNDYRIGALLALHGLRRSEVLGITPAKIVNGKILVEGSVVISENGMVAKDSNKNQTSRREVPIMIPRLTELIALSKNSPDEPYVVNGNGLWKYVRDVCEQAKLPPCTPHSLRRSFVSLAYSLGWSERECMAIGGWSNIQTMHKAYIRLSEKSRENATAKMTEFYSKA